MSAPPKRGEIWLLDLNPVRGREQSGMRPCLVISVDPFNQGPASLVIVIPITTKDRKIRTHLKVSPPEGGVREVCYIKCEDVRSVSTERLASRWGHVASATLQGVEDRLRILMGL
jgi:mRNA interferase MazF